MYVHRYMTILPLSYYWRVLILLLTQVEDDSPNAVNDFKKSVNKLIQFLLLPQILMKL